jgi:hypothetical protein
MSQWMKDLRNVKPADKRIWFSELPTWIAFLLVICLGCTGLIIAGQLFRELQLNGSGVRKSPNRRMYTELIDDGSGLHIGHLPEGYMDIGEPRTALSVKGKIISAVWLDDKEILVTLKQGSEIRANEAGYFAPDILIRIVKP